LESELLSSTFPNRIRHATFAWPYETAPLSWHLTSADTKYLHDAFAAPKIAGSKRLVCDFLAEHDQALEKKCAAHFGELPKRFRPHTALGYSARHRPADRVGSSLWAPCKSLVDVGATVHRLARRTPSERWHVDGGR